MRTRYLDIDDRSEDLAERMRDFPEVGADFLKKYELSWIHHENALEGVVYTGQELATALANQPVADATFVGAFQEIRNHKAAIDVVRQEAQSKKLRVNVTLVKRLVETLVHGAEGESHFGIVTEQAQAVFEGASSISEQRGGERAAERETRRAGELLPFDDEADEVRAALERGGKRRFCRR